MAYICGKVHFGTVLKEGLYNWKMSVLAGNVKGRGISLGRERPEQNTQTMKYSSSQCKQFTRPPDTISYSVHPLNPPPLFVYPGETLIGHWLEIRDSLYQMLHTCSAAWPEPRYMERVGSLLLILSDSITSLADFSCLLQCSKPKLSPIHVRAITLRKCVHVGSIRISRLNYIFSRCSRATLLYIVTFLNLVP